MEFESAIKKNLWIFFQKYGFIRKIKPFHFGTKHNIIQMTATASLTVPHSINPIFQYIFDCLGKRSIRKFFFENEQGAAVTVNVERYHAIFNEILFPKMKEDDMDDMDEIWFQQDQVGPLAAHPM